MANMLATVIQDLRHGARSLLRAPAFTIVAVATLAVGIGCTAAAFSVLDTVVWRGLPYSRPEQLHTVFERSDDGGLRVPSYPTFRDWHAQSASVSGAIA